VRMAAAVATVAVLIGRAAIRVGARALDEPIGQERAGRRVVELRHLLLFDQSGFADGRPNLDAKFVVSGLLVLP